MAPVAVITSSGRSGSNWLLSLFDTSPSTVCRNEPQAVSRSLLRDAVWNRPPTEAGRLLDARWADEEQRVRRMMWERDHAADVEKVWLRSCHALRAWQSWRRRRSRGAPATSGGYGDRWRIPRLLLRDEQLEASTLVLKMGPDWWVTGWFLQRQPATVIHLVRHPGAVLESWLRRLYSPERADAERELHRTWLHKAIELDPSVGTQVGDVEAMGAPELWAWHWRIFNERLAAGGEGHPAYTRVRYEDLLAEPVEVARGLIERAGVDVDHATQERLERAASRSVFGDLPSDPSVLADRWTSRLGSDERALVEVMLAGSADWW